jgi:Fe2+ or Zn2+ uptake regulation protein
MSTTSIVRNIEQQLAEMLKTEPPENGYATYKEFREDMHIIPVYPFCERFLIHLVDLAHQCHTSGVRYNRVDMFETLYKYYKRSSPKGFIKLPEEAVNKLFGIFEREVFVEGRIKVLVNYLLKGQRLNDEQLLFLVKNAFESEFALNRVLQYPFSTNIILNWVKYHSEDERLSKRRMEVTSWLMDERPYAVPSISILYNDLKLRFDDLSENDLYSILLKMKEKKIWELVATDPGYEIRSFNTRFISLRGEDVYDCLSDDSIDKDYLSTLAFYALKQAGLYFTDYRLIESVDLYQSRITTWAIVYSRLDISTKVNMLKHEYREELTNSYLHIARRLKSEELLKWMLKVFSKVKKI